MKKYLVISCLSFSFFMAFPGCKKDPSSAPDLGYTYFPDEKGGYVIYNVDSLFYNTLNLNIATHITPADTFRFQLKEKIESAYTDNEGRPALRLERYVKYYNSSVPYSGMPWILRDVWSEIRTAKTAEKVEENERFIKLAFPVKEDQQWNGNAQNAYDAETYTYEFYDLPRTPGGILFDSVLKVNHHDESSLVGWNYSSEMYARNAGLVYKRFIKVTSQPNPDWSTDHAHYPFGNDTLIAFYAKPILKRVFSGYQYTMTVTAYGKE